MLKAQQKQQRLKCFSRWNFHPIPLQLLLLPNVINSRTVFFFFFLCSISKCKKWNSAKCYKIQRARDTERSITQTGARYAANMYYCNLKLKLQLGRFLLNLWNLEYILISSLKTGSEFLFLATKNFAFLDAFVCVFKVTELLLAEFFVFDILKSFGWEVADKMH